MSSQKFPALLVILVLAGSCFPAPAGADPPRMRAGRPAEPMELPGVPNLHRVSEELYRSAQPTAEGMRNLEKLGIRTVVNLRSFHSDRDELWKTRLGYQHIFMKAWNPEEKEIVRFLTIVTNPDMVPVLVHCQHGADRTGTMTAVYRIVVQGWSKGEAMHEMTEGGFGFHQVWGNLPAWIENLDTEKIRAQLPRRE